MPPPDDEHDDPAGASRRDPAARHRARAAAALEVGRGAVAESEARRALALDPRDAEAALLVVRALLKQARYADAERAAGEALSLAPTRGYAHYLAAVCAEWCGDVPRAGARLRESVRLEPRSGLFRLRLATWLRRTGELDAARREGEAGLALAGEDPHLLGEAGWLFGKLGDLARAEDLSRRRLALAPDAPEAHVLRAWVLEQRGDYPGAAESARVALARAPNDPVAWEALGVALVHAREFTEARACLAEARRLAPGNDRVRQQLDALGARREIEPRGQLLCTRCGGRFVGGLARCPLDATPLVALPDPMLGTTVAGRYVLARKVGTGTIGVVFEATDNRAEGGGSSHGAGGDRAANQRVAIKLLRESSAANGAQRERVLAEAARVRDALPGHPHVASVLACGSEPDGLTYVVSEWLEGETLARRIAQGGALPVGDAVTVVTEAARGLAAAHASGVVHNNLRPENVFLAERFGVARVKLTDFGFELVRAARSTVRNGVRVGPLLFGPEYAAPERGAGQPTGPASDVYSLGVVLFEALTGAPPFTGSTVELIAAHSTAPPPPASALRAGLPPVLDTLLAAMLAKSARDRPRDGAALLALLDALAPLEAR